ncbi:DUF4307 domain-containing protein [Nocardioides sp. Bht2]|uniref:DUF4307 domain-containing protein n=1 Tax=Nocardioides sp. Bht2 TaxID=3392297 RepID=UPI0039B3BBA1
MSVDLADRYGTNRGGRRVVLIAVTVVISIVFLVWLGWAAWFNSSAGAKSQLQGFKIEDEHTATVRVLVSLDDGAEDVHCRARALAEDKSVVGELRFTPKDGLNQEVLTTERLAVSVDWIGCTSKGQSRAQ